MPHYRYTRWDGTQDPLAGEEDVRDLVDELSEDLLGGLEPDAALRRLLQRGMPGHFNGLRSLRDRIRQAREAERRRGRLDGILDALRERLDAILEHERLTLALRDDADAGARASFLESLPPDPAGQIRELKDYRFASETAAEGFRQLLEDLRREMVDSMAQQIAQGMRDLGAERMVRLKDMLADLNRMLDERRAGTGPTQETFDEFMRRHGAFFPENPRTLDELLEALARRSAAMSRLIASLSPEQRSELEAVMAEAMADLDLQFEVDRLTHSLRDLAPGLPWDEPARFDGEEPLGLAEALDAVERVADFEDLERTLEGAYPGASLEDVDVERLRRTLGEGAAGDLERIKRIERALEQAGIFTRRDGMLRLTPRGVRRLGERALARIFERLALDRPGSHDTPAAGGAGEPTGGTRPWQFGGTAPIDVARTVSNAVLREGAMRGRVRLRPEDFEVAEAETRTTTATVLLLDMSFSMPMRGNWVPAKRMALALQALIAGRYPDDHLSIVGFSDYARVLTPEDLARAGWEHVYGTNMQHAFSLARRILCRYPAASRQVLLVTDGEPTAHLVGERVFFQWPPVRETLEKTYREAMRLARDGVTMNIFMLEDTPALFNFVDRLARVISGRVFAIRAENLGAFAVRDYLSRRAG